MVPTTEIHSNYKYVMNIGLFFYIDNQEVYLIGFEPKNGSSELSHHMDVKGCELPGYEPAGKVFHWGIRSKIICLLYS